VELLGYTVGFPGIDVVGFAGAAILYWYFPETKAQGGRLTPQDSPPNGHGKRVKASC
jgi:hypothetical protein